MRFVSAFVTCVLAACGPRGCGCGSGPASSAPAPLVDQTPAPAPQPKPEPPPDAAQAVAATPKLPKPGFSEVKVVDRVPICLFATWEDRNAAKFVDQVSPKRLRAGASVYVAAFAPWCVHPDCDQRPSLQCTVEREGHTLVVHTKYWGDHEDGGNCTEGCYPITAGCKSEELEAGDYVVQHGELSFDLRIPGKPVPPCFGEPRPASEVLRAP